MRAAILFAYASALLIAFSAVADDAPAEKEVKAETLEKVVSGAFKANKELSAMMMEADSWLLKADSAGSLKNPELRFQVATDRDAGSKLDEFQGGLRWSPPKLGEISYEKQKANLRYAKEKAKAAQKASEFDAEVRAAYCEIWLKQSLVEIYSSKAELEKKRVELLEGLVKLGVRTAVQLTKSRLELIDLKAALESEKRKLGEARSRLARLAQTGYYVEAYEPELNEITAPVDKLLKTAVENNPELEEKKAGVKFSSDEAFFQKMKLAPWLSFIELQYHYRYSKFDMIEISFGVDIPLFDFNAGGVKGAEKRIESDALGFAAITEKIKKRARTAYDDYLAARAEAAEYEELYAKLQEQTDMAVKQFSKLESAQPDDSIELLVSLLQAKKRLVEKKYVAALRLAELRLALGLPPDGKLE